MTDFGHFHLTNLGYTQGNLPSNIYQELNKEIVDIYDASENGTLHEKGIRKANPGLAGQITKEYEITKSLSLLNPYLEEMSKAHQKQWNYYSDNKLKVESVWVNMQQKFEVNPLHNHEGVMSFVAWLHVPFKLEDERNVENCKNSISSELASTFQFVYNNVLGTITNCPLFVESGWEGTIIMFPAKLSHIVYPFQTSDDYRISIAGNLVKDERNVGNLVLA